MENNNNSVDRFLELIKKSRRGYLKIYLGMAAGVGKTYRMLLDAQRMLKQNIDVVIGYLETHGRKDTEDLGRLLPVISRKTIFYKGHAFEEMDLDEIIQRRPQVVLIDELPHTNMQGSRNEKRYQDVEEVLDNGINVITTANIQHIESLNNIIQKITGITVSERVPDTIFKMADEVVNIDLSVDELIERLKDGKIYNSDKIIQASNNFFKPDNLLQLRELTLREIANLVEKKIESKYDVKINNSNERIMACISTNDFNAKKIIRKCARLSSRLNAEWFVIYIDRNKEKVNKVDLITERKLINNLQLASELGASVIKLIGENIAEKINLFAQENNISLIMIGRSNCGILQSIINKNITSNLIKLTKFSEIDIDIVA